MLLCDSIAALKLDDTEAYDGSFDIGVAPEFAVQSKIINHCPFRYVIDSNLYEQCTFAVGRQMDCIEAAIHNELRVAHPVIWLEWLEPKDGKWNSESCQGLRRAGMLVESDEFGRAGRAKSFWLNNDGTPVQSVAAFDFDFDNQIAPGLAPYGADESAESYESFDRFFRHVAFHVDDIWFSRLQEKIDDKRVLARNVQKLFAATFVDVPFFCAFQLLLNLPRAVDLNRSRLAKLNKARKKRGALALLDHIEATMHLEAGEHNHHESHSLGYRETPRLHWVRGHFVNRSGQVHWRRSHVRGDPSIGVISSRVVHLRGGSKMPSFWRSS